MFYLWQRKPKQGKSEICTLTLDSELESSGSETPSVVRLWIFVVCVRKEINKLYK